MPYPLPLTRTEAYLAYKAGVIQQSDLKPSLAVPRNGIDAWLAYWTGLTTNYPVKNVGKNLFDKTVQITDGYTYASDGTLAVVQTCSVQEAYIQVKPNSTYTLHTEATSPQTANFRVYICEYTASKTFIKRDIPKPTTSNTNTITTTANTHFVRLCFSTIGIDTLQFEAGSTATAYEPYTGEPLILQEEEAYIAYLCGVINEYPEKCLRRVGAYLRYLISARWGRPDHPLNREELYLSLIKTQVIPSGDPSSDITIDGTAKAPFQDVKMYGDTAQQTYTGKNLLPLNGSSDTGIRGIVNADGSLTIRGTAGASRGLKVFTTTRHFTAGTYTFSISSALPSILNFTLASNVGFRIPAGETSVTTTLEQDYGGGSIFLAATSGREYDITIKAQLVSGSTPDYDFEPYVGGTPSPNPDYPQQIQTVTGRQMVTVAGKNLVGATEQSYTNQGITTTLNSDGTITCKGTCSQAYFQITRQTAGGGIAEATPCNIPAGTYTISLTNATDQFGVTLRLYASTTATDYRQVIITKGDSSNTITLTSPAVMFYIWGSSTTVGQEIDETIGIQFEQGSTATSFAPFSKQAYEINLGKNLFDKTKVTNGYYIDENGMLQESARFGYSDYIPVIAGQTYTYSGATNNSSYAGKGAWYDANKQWLSSQSFGGSGQITAPSGAAYYRTTIRIEYSSGQEPYLDTYQLEVGSIATTYAPYFTPIELCKLGTYQDYIWKDGEDWKIHKATNKITVDGSENWQYPDSGANYTFFQFSRASFRAKYGKAADFYASNTVVGFARADKFEQIIASAANMRTKQGIGFTIEGAGWLRISVANTIATTIAAFKTWLSSHPTTIDYTLATPTDTTITDQALIAQLEALVVGGAENGTTYIKVNATDPNLPGLLYVEAPKYE